MSSRVVLRFLMIGALFAAAPAPAQQCDAGNPCMANGVCMPDGTCEGTPITGGSCEFGFGDASCGINGTCVDGLCMGEPAPVGSSCSAGCGTCEPEIAGFPSTVRCVAKAGRIGEACDPGLGSCYTGICTQEPTFSYCQPIYRSCPDIDSNPCTAEWCVPATGQCEHFDSPPCTPTCEVCDSGTGICQPANEGVACDDLDACSAQSHCKAFDTLDGRHGLCVAGAFSACAGDCNGDSEVTVDEIVLGVNILLNTKSLVRCFPFDVDGSSAVEVDELVLGVNLLLNGCNA